MITKFACIPKRTHKSWAYVENLSMKTCCSLALAVIADFVLIEMCFHIHCVSSTIHRRATALLFLWCWGMLLSFLNLSFLFLFKLILLVLVHLSWVTSIFLKPLVTHLNYITICNLLYKKLTLWLFASSTIIVYTITYK